MLPSLEKREGISTPVTFSAPIASTAIDATSDESMPPERPMSTSTEAVLAHVVARAEHERLVDLAHRLQLGLDARRARRVRRSGPRSPAPRGASARSARPRGSRSRRRNPARTSRSTTSRSSTNCGARATRWPLLVEHQRRAVEDELVLTADEVHVHDRHRCVGGARREHRLALAHPTGVVRRRVDVHDELRTAGGLGEDRPGRAPRVLADRDRDLRRPPTTNSGPSTVDGVKYRCSSNTA